MDPRPLEALAFRSDLCVIDEEVERLARSTRRVAGTRPASFTITFVEAKPNGDPTR